MTNQSNQPFMKSIRKSIGIAGILTCMGINSQAQDNDQAMMKQMEHDNQATIDAIALYPTDTRRDILEAARYPEVIVRLNGMQKQSKQQFADLLDPYNRTEQEKIYNLTRYPDLISELVYDHRKSQMEIDAIISHYPSEIRKTAKEEGLLNYDLLVQIDQNRYSYLANMDKMLIAYPRVTGNAFRNLIKQPEILSTLYDNMQMTVVLGDLYKTDPQYVLFETDSLNQALTAQNTQGTLDWQQSLNEDPEAQKEYTEAAAEYAQEGGYDRQEYTGEMIPDVVNYDPYPYNWWFGYPTWYATPCWDPYPFWYDWGFYYGPGGRPVFFGMPSAHFMNWYFYKPEHCSHYSAFGNHCYGYYTKHRDSRYSNPVSRGVNDWRRRNKDVVTKDWDKDEAGRGQRFKEYGQLETSRANYNKANPGRPMERKDYLAANQGSYPHTNAVAVAARPSKAAPYERAIPQQQAPVTAPHVKIPDSFYQNQRNNNTSPAGVIPTEQHPNTNYEQRPANQNGRENQQIHSGEQPRNTSGERQNPQQQRPVYVPERPVTNQTRTANDYHQNTWQEVQPQPQYQPQPRPAPSAAPAPQSSPSSPPAPDRGGKRK
jgi:hypothetical protein